jgi:subtilase family serine protease
VHRADPKNHVWESNEGNNDSQRIVRLPWRSSKPRGCP